MGERLDDGGLIRAFEPVVRLTRGEFFLPVDVGEYVRRCTLWHHTSDGGESVMAEPGSVDLSELARLGSEYDGGAPSLSGLAARPTRRARV